MCRTTFSLSNDLVQTFQLASLQSQLLFAILAIRRMQFINRNIIFLILRDRCQRSSAEKLNGPTPPLSKCALLAFFYLHSYGPKHGTPPKLNNATMDQLHAAGKKWFAFLSGGPDYFFRGLIISKLCNDPRYQNKVEEGDNEFICWQRMVALL